MATVVFSAFWAVILLLVIWSIFWKGWALWRAAQRGQKYWFIALLIINTLGILEILYIFIFSKKGEAGTVSESKPAEISGDSNISFDKFRETDLRVAKVKSAERVAKSEKLLRLQLDDGREGRQIVAGIGKKYSPEEMVGKEIVIVANLEPRKLMGLESQGMLLAATDESGNPILVAPSEDVNPGTRLS